MRGGGGGFGKIFLKNKCHIWVYFSLRAPKTMLALKTKLFHDNMFRKKRSNV